jgi:hypothetical protein
VASIQDYLLFGFLIYMFIGMIMPVVTPRIMVEINLVGMYIPDEHVRFVCLVMFAWPAIFWVRRHYRYKVLSVKKQVNLKELKERIRLASKMMPR